jgi:hypothetical protein
VIAAGLAGKLEEAPANGGRAAKVQQQLGLSPAQQRRQQQQQEQRAHSGSESCDDEGGRPTQRAGRKEVGCAVPAAGR